MTAGYSRKILRNLALIGLLINSHLPVAFADVTLPRILGDNMVLQREQTVPIWGKASPGERVLVKFAEQEKRTTADATGNWLIYLDPMPASSVSRDMVISASNTLRLVNLLVGEVWLCAGQSNMEMAVGIATAGARPASESDPQLLRELGGGVYPHVRFFKVEKKIQSADVVSSGWRSSGGEATSEFSAIGYIFARNLQQELNVPIGMIQAAWGGTRIEPWTPPEAYKRSTLFADLASRQPFEIDGIVPGKQFNGMVRPLAPFALRGVLWYQGESNVIARNDGIAYADKMEVLIESWREAWQQKDLPFLYVQLAPYLYSHRHKSGEPQHSTTALPELWEAQARTLAVENTAMVPTMDLITDFNDIHPPQKRPIADRLVRLAMASVYDRPDPGLGVPRLEEVIVHEEDGSVLLRFAQVGDGLRSSDGMPLKGFEVAGADGVFVSVGAEIVKADTVKLSGLAVSEPVTIRFAWHEVAQPNLVDANGWPAWPFCSGDVSDCADNTRHH